jgi:LEM3 (ligand-effect modulator 3) family / CDC50 family
MGGKNPFLGIAYVVVGGICVLLGALFTVAHVVKPRYVTSLICKTTILIIMQLVENWATTLISPGIMIPLRQPLPLGETMGQVLARELLGLPSSFQGVLWSRLGNGRPEWRQRFGRCTGN